MLLPQTMFLCFPYSQTSLYSYNWPSWPFLPLINKIKIDAPSSNKNWIQKKPSTVIYIFNYIEGMPCFHATPSCHAVTHGKSIYLDYKIMPSGCAGHSHWCLLSDVLSLTKLGRVTKVVTLRTKLWWTRASPQNTPSWMCQWWGCQISDPMQQPAGLPSWKLNSESLESPDKIRNTHSWVNGLRKRWQ